MAWPKKQPRVNECGHSDRPHKARGMCDSCYARQHYQELTEEKKEIVRAKVRAHGKKAYVKFQRKIRQRYLDRFTETKKIILARYGECCQCCGEAEFHFLTLDHIYSDGAQQRRAIGHKTGYNLYRWLINHGLPDGYQTLCYNCNCGRARNGGVCPHKSNETVQLVLPLHLRERKAAYATSQPANSASVE